MKTTAVIPFGTKTSAAAMPEETRTEPVKLLRRIGSTMYTVNVHFSETSEETMEDKILRLIKGSREIEDFLGGGATKCESLARQGEANLMESVPTREVAKVA
jgi:hypothetical protein